MRRILSNALLAVWTAVWVAFWAVAFLLYAIVGGFGGSKRARRQRKPKKRTRERFFVGTDPFGASSAPGPDRAIVRECNYFSNGYCVRTADTKTQDAVTSKGSHTISHAVLYRHGQFYKRCHALDGKPCKWLDKVVRPLAPYGYVVRKDKP